MTSQSKDGPPGAFDPERAAIGARYLLGVKDITDKWEDKRRASEQVWAALQELMQESGARPPRRNIFSRFLHKK